MSKKLKFLAMVLLGIMFISNHVLAANQTLTLSDIGAALTSTANTTAATTNITATGDNTGTYTLNYYQCKKQTNTNHAMFLTKSVDAYISNKTAMPGDIVSVTVHVLTGAAKATTYYCTFSTTECKSAYVPTGSTAVNISGGSSNKYTCSVSGARYFCISLGNANNGQVWKLDVEYSSGSTKTLLFPSHKSACSFFESI